MNNKIHEYNFRFLDSSKLFETEEDATPALELIKKELNPKIYQEIWINSSSDYRGYFIIINRDRGSPRKSKTIYLRSNREVEIFLDLKKQCFFK